jgi:hypothetical protein
MNTATRHSLVQSYIADRLSEAERCAFEDQLLSDASLVRDVEESVRLREGLEVLRERKELTGLTAQVGQQGPTAQAGQAGQAAQAGLRHRRRRAVLMSFASAAAAALAVVVLYAVLHGAGPAPAVVAASVAALRVNSSVPLLVVESYSFATVRAASDTPVLGLPTSGALELRALTGPVAGAGLAFRLTLEQRRDGAAMSRIGVAEHVAPDADGFAVIYADASRLAPGDYLLLVEPDAGNAADAQRFMFKLQRAGNP